MNAFIQPRFLGRLCMGILVLVLLGSALEAFAFTINDRVQVTSGPLNVRSKPSLSFSSKIRGTQPTGALGTILAGPTIASGYTWWKIDYDSGVDGWSIGNYLTQSATPPPPPPPPLTLQNGVTLTNLQGALNTQQLYTLTVPTGATNLRFVTSGGTGDIDLYMKFGSAPTITVFDAKSDSATNAETISLATPQAGTYYLLTNGWAAYSGVSLVGAYTAAVTSAPAVSLSPTSLSFGSVTVGTASAAKAITITNTGNANLSITTNFAFTGDFNGGGNCSTATALVPGASCVLNVTFTPTVSGTRTGTITITTNAASSPNVVQLSGTGATLADTQAPSVPTNLTASAVSSSQINLRWTVSTDNTAVTGYKIYRAGTQLATVTGTTYSNTGLATSTAYTYTVAAYDAAGNTSAQSASVSATTQAPALTTFLLKAQVSNLCIRPETTPIADYTNLIQGACDSGALSFTEIPIGTALMFQVVNSNLCMNIPGAATTNGIPVQLWTCRTTNAALQFTPTTFADGSRSFTSVVSNRCVDVSGGSTLAGAAIQQYDCNGTSAQKFTKTTPIIATPDTTAPTTPTSLTAGAVSSSQINLSWNASTDNTAVTGYKIFRNGTQITTVTGTTLQNTGLTASTAYTYTVAAYDAAGNTSAQSVAVSATTQAITVTPPPPPPPPASPSAAPTPTSVLPVPTNIANGTTVSLQCGTTYQGTLNLAGKSNVTVTTAGTCGKANITPGRAVTGWTQYQGNIYSAPISFTPTQVAIAGKPVDAAHWPNRPQIWAAAGTAVPNSDLIGATLVYRQDLYTIKQNPITTNSVSSSVAYYVEGKLWMLDVPGEWAVSNGRLYMWAPDGLSPEGRVWAAADSDSVTINNTSGPLADLSSLGINANNSSGITINNVRVFSASDGISGDHSTNLHVQNTDVINSSRDALYAMGSTGLVVDSSTFTNSVRDGIGGWYSSGSIVKNNTVTTTGMVGMPKNSFAGILFGYTSKNILIDNNRVYNSSYLGITAYVDSTISNNVVDGACLVLTDGGGIYVAGFTIGGVPLNMRIEGNTISNIPTDQGIGIYLDNDSSYVTITKNKVTNAARGIFLHDTHDTTVTYNTISSSKTTHLGMSLTGSNNQINNNTFNSTGGEQTFNLEGSGLKTFATFDYNTYTSTNPNVFGRVSGAGTTATLSYSAWKTYMGSDAHSTMNGAL